MKKMTILRKVIQESLCENQSFPMLDKVNKKYKLVFKNGIKDFDEHKVYLTKKFIKFTCELLDIDSPVEVYLTNERGGKIVTTASYGVQDHQVWVYIKGRALYDIFRSIAHELVHHKQNLNNELLPDSGEDGSPHENQANSLAGDIMRKFGRLEPSMYSL